MPLEPINREQSLAPPAAGIIPRKVSVLVRGAALCACFVAALFVTAKLIHVGLPFPPIPDVREKVDWLSQHGDDYDTIFIGSSRTNRHIVPELFDRLMAQAGTPTHSFNLGVDGMQPPEDSFVLETVLKKRKARLKLVVLECSPIQDVTSEGAGTSRNLYWHDLRRSAAVIKSIFARNYHQKHWIRSSSDLWRPMGSHLNSFFGQVLNMGRGPEWVKFQFGLADPIATAPLGPGHDGFAFYSYASISDAAWKDLHSKVTSFMTKDLKRDFDCWPSQAELQQKRRWVEAHGGRMILFIPPRANGFEFNPDQHRGRPLPVLDFADPRRYPELFERINRDSTTHLNYKGAEIFTRLLVQELTAPNGHVLSASASQ